MSDLLTPLFRTPGAADLFNDRARLQGLLGFEAALAQHVLWGFMLIVLMVYGPGRISLDYLLFQRRGAASAI